MIGIKPTTRFAVLRPEIYKLFPILDDIFTSLHLPCVITSANDGTHMTGSLHYKNLAIDVRSHDLGSLDQKHEVLQKMKSVCGPDYDILFENPGEDNEHFHLEFDPYHGKYSPGGL